MRQPSQRSLGSRILRALLAPLGASHGLDIAYGPAWDALRERLLVIAETERSLGAAVAVAQSGDVEAYGMTPGGRFTGFDELHGRLWPQLHSTGAHTCDVYGNHDIWPGTFPTLTFNRQAYQEIALLGAFKSSWPLPSQMVTPSGLRLRFHRINTVIANQIAGGFAARGGVGPHPIAGPWHERDLIPALDALEKSVAYDNDGPVMNILVMHHPPHLFDAHFVTEHTLGRLEGRELLCRRLESIGIHLVIAGHRHRCDPRMGHTGVLSQEPLPSHIAQLVAPSLTAPGNLNALMLYRLHWQTGAGVARLDRLSFDYTPGGGLAVEPTLEQGLLSAVVVTL